MDINVLLIVVQIITELIPISSSGHVNLLMSLFSFPYATSSLLGYEYLVHGFTSVVLAVFFKKRWLFLLKNIRRCKKIILNLCYLGICAEIPTVTLYVLFQRYPPSVPLW